MHFYLSREGEIPMIFLIGLIVGLMIGWIILVFWTSATIRKRKKDNISL